MYLETEETTQREGVILNLRANAEEVSHPRHM
jgi:hypothetical protein